MFKVLHHVKAFRTSYGGVERVVEELVPALNRFSDVTADVLCQADVASTYQLPDKGRVIQRKTDVALSSAALSWGDLQSWRTIAHEYDAVHVHVPWPQSNLNLFLKTFSGAVIVHWHSDIVRQKVAYMAYRPLERWLLRRADKICVTSPKLLQESPSLEGVRHKAIAIPIGISDIKSHDVDGGDALQREYGGRPMIFALGRLVTYKGFEYLIRAAKEIRQPAIILIAGEGPLRGQLEAMISDCGVTDRVRLLGALSNDAVHRLMQSCDLFCLPSVERSEAFAIAQIEAMRAGRPVVSTRIPGSGVDWVNQDGVTGFTVATRSEKALANAINMLLGDERMLRKFGLDARRRYEDVFTEARMAENVRRTYLSCV